MVIGHKKQWHFLKTAFEEKKLAHAYLFCGPEKIGKKTLALEFVKLILGKDIFNPPHPDFIFVQPTENNSIQIEQIRDLIEKTSLKPFLSPFKIAILDNTHLMTEESQNSFLKTLEEPPGETIFFLITSSSQFLLPTIVSRCQIIKFYPLSFKEIEEYLTRENISREKIKEIVKFSFGRPGLAFDFISNPEKLEKEKKRFEEFIKVLNSDIVARFQYIKKLTRENVGLIEILTNWLNFFNLELLGQFNSSFKRSTNFSLDKIKKILKELEKTFFLISRTNINSKLALDILMINI